VTEPFEHDDEPKKPTRAKIVRTVVAVVVALACGGAFAWMRWGMTKSGLGERCAYRVNCGESAPTCLKQSIDEDGVCSRPCEPGVDCAPGIACVKVELEERDDRGNPLEGGYCFPQALIDARKKRKKPVAEAGAPRDSYVDVPESPGLEGEIEVSWTRGKAGPETETVLVKGTLVRTVSNGPKRMIADASTMRVYVVDDDKKTFAAAALEGDGSRDGVKLEKTEEKSEVAGRTCEIWRITEPKVVREVCIVHGGAFVDPVKRSAPVWLRELAVRTAFPLRMVERDGDAERSRMTVTRIDGRPLDGALFAVPKAYKNLAAK
jgi:hypothetical protein